MTKPTVRLNLNNSRTIATADMLNSLAHGFINCHHIIAVLTIKAWNTISLSTRVEVRCICGIVNAHGNPIAVVNDKENHRKLPSCCHIDRLMEGALICCAISRKGHNDIVGPLVLLCQGSTYSKGIATSNDTICSIVSFFKISQVH